MSVLAVPAEGRRADASRISAASIRTRGLAGMSLGSRPRWCAQPKQHGRRANCGSAPMPLSGRFRRAADGSRLRERGSSRRRRRLSGHGYADPDFPGVYARIGADRLHAWVTERIPHAELRLQPAEPDGGPDGAGSRRVPARPGTSARTPGIWMATAPTTTRLAPRPLRSIHGPAPRSQPLQAIRGRRLRHHRHAHRSRGATASDTTRPVRVVGVRHTGQVPGGPLRRPGEGSRRDRQGHELQYQLSEAARPPSSERD